jgi:hypothetical protein
MRYLRLFVIGVALTTSLVGCGGNPEGTTMPTSTVTAPPEMEQMKAEMQKHLQQQVHRSGNRAHRPSAGHRS